MKRSKVLFLTNRNPYPVVDGQSRRTYNILKGLALDFDVYLLALYELHEEADIRNSNLLTLCSGVEFYPCPPKHVSLPIARLVRSLFSKYPYTVWRHWSKEYHKRVYELLAEQKFDLIHCDCLPLAPVVRDVHNILTVLTDHDVSYLKSQRMAQQSKNWFQKCFLYYEAIKVKLFEQNIFKSVDLAITVSEFDQKILQELSPEARLEVVENGVDTQEFSATISKTEANSLLWFGGFGHYPNYEAMDYFLNDIYYRIKEKIKDVKLVVVGGGVPPALKQFAENDSSIKFLGFVEDPVPYLAVASVLICPILSGSGTRLKILEAMAMEKAIVSTGVGVEGIEGKNGEHFIVSDTPQEFADSVVAVLQSKTLEKELGRSARILVEERYDWKNVIWKRNKSLYSKELRMKQMRHRVALSLKNNLLP